jgi:hypothetical protein
MCERYWPLYITVISVILWFFIVYSFNISHDASNTPNQEMTSGPLQIFVIDVEEKGAAAAMY